MVKKININNNYQIIISKSDNSINIDEYDTIMQTNTHLASLIDGKWNYNNQSSIEHLLKLSKKYSGIKIFLKKENITSKNDTSIQWNCFKRKLKISLSKI
tara:strand:+ start:208 stop:507 length:300 start_codon:yes stop_codon:yes gene_type:complete